MEDILHVKSETDQDTFQSRDVDIESIKMKFQNKISHSKIEINEISHFKFIMKSETDHDLKTHFNREVSTLNL